MNYAPRISLPYHDLSGVINVWAESCHELAVFEHEADVEVNTTHVHMIMIGCKYKKPDMLKRIFYARFPDETRKGNALWSWENKDFPNPNKEFIKYMTKGIHSAKFLKNISEQEVENWRQQWVQTTPKTTSLRQTSLDEDAKKKKTKYSIVLDVVKLILAKHPMATTEERRQAILNDVEDEIVIKAIRKVLISDNQVLGLYKVMDIYDAFVMYHQKGKFISNCLMVLQKRLPRV